MPPWILLAKTRCQGSELTVLPAPSDGVRPYAWHLAPVSPERLRGARLIEPIEDAVNKFSKTRAVAPTPIGHLARRPVPVEGQMHHQPILTFIFGPATPLRFSAGTPRVAADYRLELASGAHAPAASPPGNDPSALGRQSSHRLDQLVRCRLIGPGHKATIG